jgi:hypothetical protein
MNEAGLPEIPSTAEQSREIYGEPVIGSGMEAALIEAGFRRQPRKLVA